MFTIHTKIYQVQIKFSKHFLQNIFLLHKDVKRSISQISSEKQGFKKQLLKGIKVFLKRSKTKSEKMVTHDITNFRMMKSKGWLSTEQKIKYGKIKLLHK